MTNVDGNADRRAIHLNQSSRSKLAIIKTTGISGLFGCPLYPDWRAIFAVTSNTKNPAERPGNRKYVFK
jgi:hypothetical protein